MAEARYLIALGSNIRHHRHGDPRVVLRAALEELGKDGLKLMAAARIIDSAPLGPSRRRFANGAVLIATRLAPPTLLARLKEVERHFGRRRSRRWGARVLDLDIILWSGGAWRSRELILPHRAFRQRRFVLTPALDIVPDWRDPITGLTVRQLHSRLTRRLPLPRARPR